MLCDYTLVTNGCSFSKTIFPGLSQEESEPFNWPHHLAKLLSCSKLENLAYGGGSNQRIHRTTFNRLLGSGSEKIILVVQLTELSRFEWCYNSQPKTDFIFEFARGDNWIRGFTNQEFSPGNKLPKFSDAQVTHLNTKLSVYSDLEAIYKLCAYLGNIKMLCDAKSIPYLFWFPQPWYYFLDIKFKKYIVEHLKYYWFSTDSIYTKISNEDGHPDQEGHKIIADQLYQRINEYGLLK